MLSSINLFTKAIDYNGMIEEKQFDMLHFAIGYWDISNPMDLYKFKGTNSKAVGHRQSFHPNGPSSSSIYVHI